MIGPLIFARRRAPPPLQPGLKSGVQALGWGAAAAGGKTDREGPETDA